MVVVEYPAVASLGEADYAFTGTTGTSSTSVLPYLNEPRPSHSPSARMSVTENGVVAWPIAGGGNWQT